MKAQFMLVGGLVAVLIAGAATVFAGGCARQQEPPSNASASRQGVIAAESVVSLGHNGRSLSGVASGDRIVVGFTDLTTSALGWAVSTDGVAFQLCNAASPSVACGTPIPTPPSWEWRGESSLAAEGKTVLDGGVFGSNNVVYATLASSAGLTTDTVSVLVSHDDGASFGKAAYDRLTLTSCGQGSTVGSPSATFDYTTSPPTLWVAYTGGTSVCIASGQFSNGGVLALASPQEVKTVSSSTVTGVKVQAGDGYVTIVYQDQSFPTCGSPGDTTPTTQSWHSTTSFDLGTTWSDEALIMNTSTFQPCIGLGSPTLTAKVLNSRQAFDFLRAPDGTYYVAVNDSKNTIRLFASSDVGTKHGAPSNASDWAESCLSTPTTDGGSLTDPVANWLPVATGRCPVAFREDGRLKTFMPTLAADSDSRIALSYYVLSDDGNVQAEFVYSAGPRDPNESWQLLSGGLDNSFLATPLPSILNLGAYMTIIAGPSLFAFPPNGHSCNDYSVSVSGGTAKADFRPFWVQIIRGAGPTIETRHVYD